MELIIKVPDEVYRRLKAGDTHTGNTFHNAALKSIIDGEPYDEMEVWKKSNQLLNKRLTYLDNSSKDTISRKALQDKMKEADAEAIDYEMLVAMYEKLVDEAPPVPGRLQCNQNAWEEGYEVGLEQGKKCKRQKGEWLKLTSYFYKCSVCGRNIHAYDVDLGYYPYCHCGADMRGKENEESD